MKLSYKSYQKYNDEELMRLSTKGERAAFEILYDRYFDKLTWFARQYISGVQQAEDVIQEVFIKIIEQPELFDHNKKFSTWAYTIVANKCKNILRDTQNRKELLSKKPLNEITEMQHHYDYGRLQSKMKEVISGMNQKEKTLFVLRFEHDLPIKEIAEITSSPEGTVKSGIFYLLKKLSNHLKPFRDE